MSIYCVCLVNFSYIYINVKYMNVTLRMSNPSHLPVSLELIGGAWAVCASASGIKPACFCLCSENSLLPTSNIQKHPNRSTSIEII